MRNCFPVGLRRKQFTKINVQPVIVWGTIMGARLRGCTGRQHSKKGSEKVLGRVLRRGPAMGFTVEKG